MIPSNSISTLALFSAILMTGCDSSTSSTGPTTPTTTASIDLTGRVRLDNAGSGTIIVTAAGLESALTRNSDGSYSYSLVGTGKVAAARALSDTVVGFVYLVANDTDTLREIAIRSWTGTVPTNYVVQRNLSITVPAQYVSDTVEAVYWSTDSVAYVLRAPRSSGVKHSTYIYTAYDSASYYNGKYLFTAFARIRNQHGVVAYTQAFDTTYADAGDLGAFDASDFVVSNDNILKSVPGYTVIVNGKHVSDYAYIVTVTDSTTTRLAGSADSALWHGWHGAVTLDENYDTIRTDSAFTHSRALYMPDTLLRAKTLYSNGVDTLRRQVPDSLVVELYTNTDTVNSSLYTASHRDQYTFSMSSGSYDPVQQNVTGHSYWMYATASVVDSTTDTGYGYRYRIRCAWPLVLDTTKASETAVYIGNGDPVHAQALQLDFDYNAAVVTRMRFRTEQVVYTRTTKTTAARKR
jgi:hypothetical protein